MSAFEPGFSGVRPDHSANCATTSTTHFKFLNEHNG